MAIAHPDRRAARGGWGLEVGGSMRADRGYPGDPTPHTDRQTDTVEAARPLTSGWLPSPAVAPMALPLLHHLPCLTRWAVPLPHTESFTGQRKPPQEGVLKLGPSHCTLESKNWSFEALPLSGPRFPNLYKAEEGRHALRSPPCPDFPWSLFSSLHAAPAVLKLPTLTHSPPQTSMP